MLSDFKQYIKIVFILTILTISSFTFYLSKQYKINEYFITTDLETKSDSEYTDNKKINEEKKNWEKIDFIKRYPFLTNCKHDYQKRDTGNRSFEYTEYKKATEAPKETHDIRITRALIFYFPLGGKKSYQHELRWVYRSWIDMIGFEPAKWRTDLVIFIESDSVRVTNSDFSLKELGCRFENVRQSPEDKPMCTLFKYVALENRSFGKEKKQKKRQKAKVNQSEWDELYRYFLNDVDVFDESNDDEFDVFLRTLKNQIGSYRYLNSILIGFEGYSYFKDAGYDFIIRSDMDIFLTPLFGSWLPRHCNDFNVGRAAFSTDFNEKRLGRAANRIGLEYAYRRNLGSTWYSTPTQIRLVSYLTLFGMMYVAREEFTPVERQGKIGPRLWPFWHYGVLLLYGQSIALNHLIANKQIPVVKNFLMDVHSGFDFSTHSIILIHVYHSPAVFSKFKFKAGVYDTWTNATVKSDEVRYHALRMAVEGKRFECSKLRDMLREVTSNKI